MSRVFLIRARSSFFTTLAFTAPFALGLTEAIRGAWVSDEFLAWTRSPNPVAASPHFLWAVLVVALHRGGFGLEALGRYLPIVCWAGLLAVLVVHAVRSPLGSWSATSPLSKGTRHDLHLMAPVAAWGLVLHRDAQVFASGGLETSLFALLLTGGLLLVVNHPRQNGLGASVYALAALVRPEGFVYSAIAFAYVLWRGGVHRLVRFAIVWCLLLIPYLFRTLYSRAAPTAPASISELGITADGWLYTAEFFRVYFVLLACGLGALGGWLAMRAHRRGSDPRMDAVSFGLVQVLATVVMVVVRGGDAMFARAYIPVTPILYLIAEEVVRMTGKRIAVAGLAVFVIVSTLAARWPREQAVGKVGILDARVGQAAVRWDKHRF